MAKKKKNKSTLERIDKLTKPLVIVDNLISPASFKVWARVGNIIDIKNAIPLFEKEELYEHCKYLMEVIEEKRKEVKKKRWTNK